VEISLGDDVWDLGTAFLEATRAATFSGTTTPVYDEEGRRVATIVPYKEEG
jgi:hypothetical protein